MNELPFVIWMLGWAFCCEFILGWRKRCGFNDSPEVRFYTSFANFVIWLIIGCLLWVNRK